MGKSIIVLGPTHRKCDICGDTYSIKYKKFSQYFSDIQMSDSIRIELVEANTTAISTFKVCPACAGKVLAHIVQMKKEAGTTSVL